MSFSPLKSHKLRIVASGLLAYGLLLPAATIHAAAGTGTLVGNVTCGPDEELPAGSILGVAEGMNLQTHTDAGGRFSLVGVPAAQTLTIDAMGDAKASRDNVVVQPGEVLDIGSMDLSICPAPSVTVPEPQQQEQYRETPD